MTHRHRHTTHSDFDGRVGARAHFVPHDKDGVLSFDCIAKVRSRQRARRGVVGGVLGAVVLCCVYSAVAWGTARDERVPVQSSLLRRVQDVDTAAAAEVLAQHRDKHDACPYGTEVAVFQAVDGGSCVLPSCVPRHSNDTVRSLVALTYTAPSGAQVCTLHVDEVPFRVSHAKRAARASTFALLVVALFLAPTLVASVRAYELSEQDEVHRAVGVREPQPARGLQHVRDVRAASRRVRDHPAWTQQCVE